MRERRTGTVLYRARQSPARPPWIRWPGGSVERWFGRYPSTHSPVAHPCAHATTTEIRPAGRPAHRWVTKLMAGLLACESPPIVRPSRAIAQWRLMDTGSSPTVAGAATAWVQDARVSANRTVFPLPPLAGNHQRIGLNANSSGRSTSLLGEGDSDGVRPVYRPRSSRGASAAGTLGSRSGRSGGNNGCPRGRVRRPTSDSGR